MIKFTLIEPSRLRKSLKDHPWIFAYYVQSPDERDDGKWSHAVVFRNQERTEFGAFEIVDESLTVREFDKRFDTRQIAARIIRDADFRTSLLRDPKEYRDLWRRH